MWILTSESQSNAANFYTCVFYQQKEEGKVQGQLNHTDSSQYIRDLKDQIADLKHEVRLLKQTTGPPVFTPPFYTTALSV